MAFEPPYCPHADCEKHQLGPFPWRRRGTYRRKCDGRRVQRFECLACRRRFSIQSFRVDYRLKKPALTGDVFEHMVAKTTQRQTARALGVNRKTVAHRLRLLGEHSFEFHQERLRRVEARGGVVGHWSLDELETFESNRRLKPLTVPVLIETGSFFIVHAECAPLPPRRPLKPAAERRLAEIEAVEGKRRSGSTKAVRACFEQLDRIADPNEPLWVVTDKKKTYPGILRSIFGQRVRHVAISSKRTRDTRNPMFRINLTLAMMRDGMSRLVRRSWAGSKVSRCLVLHNWVWIAYRNYLRPMTNQEAQGAGRTPAMVLGVESKRWSRADFLRWRVPPAPAA